MMGRGSLFPELALAASIAFVAGVLIFQVLKHELPETEGHFGAFLAGVVGFGGLLVAISVIRAWE